MKIVLTFLKAIPGGHQRILKKNQEQLFISHGARFGTSDGQEDDDGNDSRVSELCSYPASVAGTPRPVSLTLT
jgi:hypothetical protein